MLLISIVYPTLGNMLYISYIPSDSAFAEYKALV